MGSLKLSQEPYGSLFWYPESVFQLKSIFNGHLFGHFIY